MTPSILWLTSRSAHERGTQHCAFARWAEYHAGAYGYGWQRRALSLPLVTGTYVDRPISAILQWIKEATEKTGQQPRVAPDAVIRWAAQLAVKKYHAVVAKRGILALAQDDETAKARLSHLIAEQTTLIEGLVWVWCTLRLPAILAEEKIVWVQPEETFVESCTCGLGDLIGEVADHEARGCNGIGVQSRPDVVTQVFSTLRYRYRELKTAAQAKRAWNSSWERKQQFLLGILGTERRAGVDVSDACVEGIIKGSRRREWTERDNPNATKYQQNSLCYAYLRPANPGLSLADWKPGHEYYDQDGMKHRTPKEYTKTAIWEAPDDAFPGKPEGMSRVEWWVRYLAVNFPNVLQKSVNVVGPIPKQRNMLDKAIRSSIAEERLWQYRVWSIYDYASRTGQGWDHPDYRKFVDGIIPRSWNCDPYGPDHPCSCQPLCFEHEGFDKPVESGLFVYRSPHHETEAGQMKARGLEPEEGVGYEPDEDDDGDWE